MTNRNSRMSGRPYTLAVAATVRRVRLPGDAADLERGVRVARSRRFRICAIICGGDRALITPAAMKAQVAVLNVLHAPTSSHRHPEVGERWLVGGNRAVWRRRAAAAPPAPAARPRTRSITRAFGDRPRSRAIAAESGIEMMQIARKSQYISAISGLPSDYSMESGPRDPAGLENFSPQKKTPGQAGGPILSAPVMVPMMMPVVMPMMVPAGAGDRRRGNGECDGRRKNVT